MADALRGAERPVDVLVELGAAGFDQGLPEPHVVRRADGTESSARDSRIGRLNDQHAYLDVGPATRLEVGDWVDCVDTDHLGREVGVAAQHVHPAGQVRQRGNDCSSRLSMTSHPRWRGRARGPE